MLKRPRDTPAVVARGARHGRGASAYRPDIDGLRAVAVSIVVLFHFGFTALPGGFVGVDVFFVISGYLITAITRAELAEGRFSLLAFYERRIRRIVPALAAVLLATGFVSLFIVLPEDMRIIGKSTEAAALFSANLLFSRLSADYFAADNLTLQPLLHTWSLAVEGQFYLIFPLLMVALRGRPRAVTVVLTLLTALSFAFGAWGALHRPVASFYLLPGRAWELLAGGLLASWSARPGPRSARPGTVAGAVADASAVLGLLCIALATLFFNAATPFPGTAALLPCLGAVLVIAAGTPPGGRVSALLGTPLPVGLGRISYSVYLWHWPVLVLAHYGRESALPLGPRLGLLGAVLALSMASYALIERPFIARRLLPRRAGLFAAAGAVTLAALASGQALDLAGRGLLPLGRLPAAVLTLADGHFDRLEGECPVPDGTAPDRPYPCRFGAPGSEPTVALWGNSYARMWIPALSADAEAHGAGGIALIFSKCPPLLGREVASLPGCASFNRAAIAYVAGHPSIRSVVLGADWFMYEADLGLLDGTIAALTAQGVTVSILLSPPQIDYQVPRTLAMAALRHEPPPPPPREAQSLASLRPSHALVAAAAARQGATLIDPATRLCDGSVCPVARDGHALYYDAGHLTVFAVAAIHGLFDGVFAGLATPEPR